MEILKYKEVVVKTRTYYKYKYKGEYLGFGDLHKKLVKDGFSVSYDTMMSRLTNARNGMLPYCNMSIEQIADMEPLTHKKRNCTSFDTDKDETLVVKERMKFVDILNSFNVNNRALI